MAHTPIFRRLAALSVLFGLTMTANADAPVDAQTQKSKAEAIRSTALASVKNGQWSRKGIMFDATGGIMNERNEPVCITEANREFLLATSLFDTYVELAGSERCKFSALDLADGKLSINLSCALGDDPEQENYTDRLEGNIAAEHIELTAKGEVFGQMGNNYSVTMQRTGDCSQKDVSETQPQIAP